MNKQQITEIIKEAISKGYMPEKKEPIKNRNLYSPKDGSLTNMYAEDDIYKGYNQAIDSFQLEKLIELAYENIREKIEEYQGESLIIYDGVNHPYIDYKNNMYSVDGFLDEIIANLLNKE